MVTLYYNGIVLKVPGIKTRVMGGIIVRDGYRGQQRTGNQRPGC